MDDEVKALQGKEEGWKEALKRIKDEIENDPAGIGYSGKSFEEITNLLNNPEIEGGAVKREARIHSILIGVPYAPNIVTVDQVKEAMVVGG